MSARKRVPAEGGDEDFVGTLVGIQVEHAKHGLYPESVMQNADIWMTIGRIRRLSALVQISFEPVYRRFNVTEGEYQILNCLLRLHLDGPVSPTQLKRELTIPAPTVTKRLMYLEDKGLIERKRTDQDRRAFLVQLRPEGRDLVFAIFPELEKEVIAALAKYPDIAEANEVLRTLLLNVEASMKERSYDVTGIES